MIENQLFELQRLVFPTADFEDNTDLFLNKEKIKTKYFLLNFIRLFTY
jgi:hypothetical protein